MNSTEYKQCVKCVMDTTTTLIKFDEEGVCNFCHDYDKLASKTVNRPKEERYKDFELSINEIKKWGVGKKYDCILGLSGGLDSSYMALIAKEYGLRPLLVHFDNGWNSEVAIKNIENIVNKTGFDLYTYVINWEEFKDLQIAYFKASVIDIEVPTDQLIFASLYKIAYERNIKYILSG
ncbi:MAG TPA: 7-cyano-7-deazaguanine synthase, partial [Bacteroidia bacterium]|nr:7-cyano-7-deazaguanine synthase [Bacteroidia bacterium]